MDNKDQGQELIDKYLAGKASEEEKTLVERFYLKQYRESDLPEMSSDVNQLKTSVWKHISSETGFDVLKIKTRLWRRIAVAAVVTVFIGTGLLYFSKFDIGSGQQLVSNINDIPPGRNGATLTLANGEKIYISDAAVGELAEQAGVSIRKTTDGQLIYEIKESGSSVPEYNTLQTSNGQQTQVVLPDKSRVFLNAASSITYPSSFSFLKERRIELEGEAYFEIAKDESHPFIVKTKMQEVRVLGTHFNISSYSDEDNVKTTLLEGSVKVIKFFSESSSEGNRPSTGNQVVLKPGQQSNLKDNLISVSEIDVEEAIAWKNGYFMFNNESLESVMRKISRWYNVQVVYKDDLAKTSVFYGTISRFNNVSQVLRMLEMTKEVTFKVEGKQITVMGKRN